jgi:DNA-directed RNA polymerase specialized sigma24 family protein
MGLKASWPGLAGHHDPAAAALCTRAAAGDQGAWDDIVERYAPMVWAICTRFRLSGRDLEDVAQNVWLLLAEQLGKLPEPAALAGWLAAATRRECLRAALAELPSSCQSLMDMLISDPPYSYAAISTALGIPVECIGPRRARCLERIRESSALLGLAHIGGNLPGGDPGA